MESFFHTLKTELIHHRQYATRDEAERDIFAYVEGFYNQHRRHSAIGYQPGRDGAKIGLNSVHFFGGRSVLVALPHEHPLTARRLIYWADLRGETVLLSYYAPWRDIEDLVVSKLVLPEDQPRIERHDVSRGMIKPYQHEGGH